MVYTLYRFLHIPVVVVPDPVSTGPPLPALVVVYWARKPGRVTE